MGGQDREDRVTDFLDVVRPDHREGCLLVGHYGAGNYGDELLLEVALRRLREAGVARASFLYRAPERYPLMHRDYGYRMVPGGRFALLRALVRARSVVVGGGGLWGRDATHNTLLLSLGIWAARRLLGKPVYLLGVGYYGSATRWACLGARFAARGSTLVLARDAQTEANFRRYTRAVRRGTDLALTIKDTDLDGYRPEATAIGAHLRVGEGDTRTTFVALRRFRDDLDAGYRAAVARLVAELPDRSFVLATLEPPDVDPANRAWALDLRRRHANVSVFEFNHNPMALLAWLREHADRLMVVGPQFHLLVSAHLTGAPLYPMAYDDKVEQFLRGHGYGPVRSFYALDYQDLRAAVEKAAAPADRMLDGQPG